LTNVVKKYKYYDVQLVVGKKECVVQDLMFRQTHALTEVISLSNSISHIAEEDVPLRLRYGEQQFLPEGKIGL
jgi:hypothetical protein